MSPVRGPWYRRQLLRAREARRAARAGRSCAVCRVPIGDRPASARYCSVACRMRAHYIASHPGARRNGRARPRASLPEIPPLEAHPLVAAAIAALRESERREIGTAFDSGPRDLVCEHVLAALEGRDPDAAMAAERARRAEDRIRLVFGTALVDGLER